MLPKAVSPSVLLINTELEKGDDEQDRSVGCWLQLRINQFKSVCIILLLPLLLYTQLVYLYSLESHGTQSNASDAATANVLKGLSLAVRGVLGSICGEVTRAIRLVSKTQLDSIVLAVTNLQSCMAVMVLPGSLPDMFASSLVLLLVQSLVLIAGPSYGWLVPDLSAGTSQPSVLKRGLKALMDRVCHGVLSQLQGLDWALCLPSLVLEAAVMNMHISPDYQAVLEDLLQRHQAGAAPTEPSAPDLCQQGAAPPFRFHQRKCCLMYRGQTVFSGLSPSHTRLVWQLCWALQCFNAASAAADECQIICHTVYMAAPAWDPTAADVARGNQRSLLVLASAAHMVLAVQLEAYDEEMDSELAGKCEGQAAVELLSTISVMYGPELEAACTTCALLHSLTHPVKDTSAILERASIAASVGQRGVSAPQNGMGAEPQAGSSRGGGLLAKLLLRRQQSPGRGTASEEQGQQPTWGQSESGAQGGDDTQDHNTGGTRAALTGPSLTAGVVGARAASVSAVPHSGLLGTLSGADGGPGASPSRPTGPLRLMVPSTPDGRSLRAQPGGRSLGLGAGVLSRLGGGAPRPGALPPRGGKQHGQRRVPHPHQHQWEVSSPEPAVLVYEPLQGSVQLIAGDVPFLVLTPPDFIWDQGSHYGVSSQVAEAGSPHAATATTQPLVPALAPGVVWETLAKVRLHFGRGRDVAVDLPPKHSRLCMTLGQIERLSALRAPREGGQRLGSADSAPWEYHPELANLALAEQVTVQIPANSSSALQGVVSAGSDSTWFITGFRLPVDDCEVFIIHSAAQDEQEALQRALVIRAQARRAPV